MSSTNVKVRTSSAHSKKKYEMPKSMAGAYNDSRQSSDDAVKASSIPRNDEDKDTKSVPPTSDDTAKKSSPIFGGITKKVRPYLDKHGHAIVYGIIGIVAAILILTIGFWPVLLLAIFAAIGIVIGRLSDSGISMQSAARSLAENLRR